MDFRGRGAPAPSNSSASQLPNSFSSNTAQGGAGAALKGANAQKWMPLLTGVLIILVAIMLVAVTLFVSLGGNDQANAINKKQYQAVFLNNGQVYFGKIKELNKSYVNLTDIYYLQTNGSSSDASASSAPTNVTLVKLGCELHGPNDQMLINDSQVLFWENLKDNSQVVTKIAEAKKANPNNTCSTSSNSTQQSPSSSSTTQPTTSTQSSTGAPSSGNTSTPTPKKP